MPQTGRGDFTTRFRRLEWPGVPPLARRALLSSAPKFGVFHALFVPGWSIQYGRRPRGPQGAGKSW